MRRVGVRNEEGQVLVLFAAGLFVALLAAAGIVLDFGHAYVVKRKLQAAADAAAIAAADDLPSVANAFATAGSYGTAGKNAVAGASQSVSAYCLKSVSYCYGGTPGTGVGASGQANGIVVKESASVPTTFLKLFGVSSVPVTAKATACGLCGAVPLDIAVVVDRTGSMSSNMDDLRAGLRTFLGSLNPTLDWVSLLVLPPAPGGDSCTPAANGAYPYQSSSYPTAADDSYAVVHWSHDYLSGGKLNPSSRLVSQIGCMAAQGGTAYKDAIAAAKSELDSFPSDRQQYTKVIVFETDGAANTAPDSYFDRSTGHAVGSGYSAVTLYSPTSAHASDVNRPCGSALDYANGLKSQGIVFLTVAYSVQRDDGCYQAPHITGSRTSGWGWNKSTTYYGVGYKDQSEGTTAGATLQAMASPGDAFSASSAASMSDAFAAIAGKLVGAKLVPDGEAGS